MTREFTPLPIRSALLTPGDDEKRLRGAIDSAADAVLVDLEAGVAHDRLRDARALVAGLLPDAAEAGKLVVVRVNPISSGHTEADLDAVVGDSLYGVALAKVDGARDVRALHHLLDDVERAAGVPCGRTVVHPLLEDASAVRRAYRIGRASTRVAHLGGIVAPGGDLARSIGFSGSFSAADTRYVREKVLVDGRAAGVKFPLTGIPVGRDVDDVRTAALDARAMGYEGLVIGVRSHAHIANEVFTPNAAEVARWRAVAAGEANGRRAPDPDARAWARDRLVVAERFGVA